jgi:hypothetical protein
MTKEKTTIDKVETRSTELVAPGIGAIGGFEHFEGFAPNVIVEHTPYIVLVQGPNSLKKELGAVDGQFVIDKKLGTDTVEVQLLTSGKRYKEMEYSISSKGEILTSGVKNILTIAEFAAVTGMKKKQKDFILVSDSTGALKSIFVEVLTLVVMHNGFPHKMVFKTTNKLKQAGVIMAAVMRESIRLKANSIQELVLTLKSVPVTSGDHDIYEIELRDTRKATEAEINSAKSILSFLNVANVVAEEEETEF